MLKWHKLIKTNKQTENKVVKQLSNNWLKMK